jgi:hypothetical protein
MKYLFKYVSIGPNFSMDVSKRVEGKGVTSESTGDLTWSLGPLLGMYKDKDGMTTCTTFSRSQFISMTNQV